MNITPHVVLAATLPAKVQTVTLGRDLARKYSTADRTLMPPGLLDALTFLKASTSSHSILTVLAKSGIRTQAELSKHSNKFYAKANATDIALITPKEFRAKALLKLSKLVKYQIFTASYHNPAVAAATLTASINTAIIDIYAYLGTKLCAALAVPYKPTIAEYLLFGTGLGVPAQIKALCTKTAQKEKVTKAKSIDGMALENLTIKDFKDTSNFALVQLLPKLFTDYAKRTTPLTPAQKRSISKFRSSWQRAQEKRDLKAKIDSKAIPALKQAVSTELFTFYSLVLPALKGGADNKESIATLKQSIRGSNRSLASLKRQVKNAAYSPAARRAWAKKIITETEKLGALKAKLAPLKDELASVHKAGMKAWMLPYLSSTVDITGSSIKVKAGDTGLLLHRLVSRANTGKLVAGDKELEAVLDQASALLLNYKGISTIIDACDESSVRAFKTVFKNVSDIAKPKAFTIALMKKGSTGLDTAIGRVTDAKLLRLNNISAEDESALTTQFQKEFDAWNPLKLEVSALATKIDTSPKVKAAAYTATPSSKAQLEAYREDLPQFMSHQHSVKIEIVKSWEAHPSPQILALLSNVKASGNLKVIRNVFHGCAKQTGSIILHSGFKISGTQVTARSMGDVLYVASCVDKSAQYLGKGFTRRAGQTGIIFMGDIIVSGAPAMAATSVTDKTFGWTATSNFKTAEIGLVNPNKQFVIKHVFLIKISPSSVTAKRSGLADKMRSFEDAVPLKEIKLHKTT